MIRCSGWEHPSPDHHSWKTSLILIQAPVLHKLIQTGDSRQAEVNKQTEDLILVTSLKDDWKEHLTPWGKGRSVTAVSHHFWQFWTSPPAYDWVSTDFGRDFCCHIFLVLLSPFSSLLVSLLGLPFRFPFTAFTEPQNTGMGTETKAGSQWLWAHCTPPEESLHFSGPLYSQVYWISLGTIISLSQY